MAADKKSKKKLLRQRAEKLLSKKSTLLSKMEHKDLKKLVHELQVHQVELEMQNDELRRAQEEIEESRPKYSDLYEFAPIGYFTFSPSGEILEVNLTGASLLGIERKKLIRRPFSAFVEPDFRSHFLHYCRSMLSSGKMEQCDLKLIKKGGESFYASLQSILVRDSKRVTIRSAVSDITELKKTQVEIRQLNTELEDRIRRRTAELQHLTETLEERVKERTAELSELSSKLVSAQENERRRVSYDLHDNVWQTLVTIRFEIQNLFSNQEDWATLQSKSKQVMAKVLDTVGKSVPCRETYGRMSLTTLVSWPL